MRQKSAKSTIFGSQKVQHIKMTRFASASTLAIQILGPPRKAANRPVNKVKLVMPSGWYQRDGCFKSHPRYSIFPPS